MNTSNRVDVVIAGSEPDTAPLDAGEGKAPEQVDVSPDPRQRIIVLAATKQDGYDEARAQGIEPVAVVTPRSLNAARGIVADEIIDARSLTPEMRDTILPHAMPSLATTREAGA